MKRKSLRQELRELLAHTVNARGDVMSPAGLAMGVARLARVQFAQPWKRKERK
jgi:hypothetical protein